MAWRSCFVGVVLPLLSWSAEPNAELTEFLARQWAAKAADLAALSAGRAYATVLPASASREIVTVGAVRIQSPAEDTVALVRDIARLESGKGFRHTQLLSRPPVLGDFAALELSTQDVAELKKCRPGDCSFKLGKADLALVAEMDWASPDAVLKVNQMARRAALNYVNAYAKGETASWPSM